MLTGCMPNKATACALKEVAPMKKCLSSNKIHKNFLLSGTVVHVYVHTCLKLRERKFSIREKIYMELRLAYFDWYRCGT